jgi:hypothetical protein
MIVLLMNLFKNNSNLKFMNQIIDRLIIERTKATAANIVFMKKGADGSN